MSETIDTWLLGRLMERTSRRDLEFEVFNWTNAMVRNHRESRHDWTSASRTLTQIAAVVGVANARALELNDLCMAQLEAWREMYGGSECSSNLGFERLQRINAR